MKKVDVQLLPKNSIAKLYSITPAILKTEYGYWKEHLSLEEYALAIKTNLIKKYNALKKIEMNESFQLFEKIELINRKPITCAYKNVNLLGDKMDL